MENKKKRRGMLAVLVGLVLTVCGGALTLTVGGEICGYCAIGSCVAAIEPAMTMISEMTMANIGRWIKNLDKTPPP